MIMHSREIQCETINWVYSSIEIKKLIGENVERTKVAPFAPADTVTWACMYRCVNRHCHSFTPCLKFYGEGFGQNMGPLPWKSLRCSFSECTYSISGSGSSMSSLSFRQSPSSNTASASCSSELLELFLLLLGGILYSLNILGGPQFAAIQPSGHSLSSSGQFTSSCPFFTW